MRKLTHYIAVTIDGRIAGPAGETDFFLVDGDHQAGLNEEYADTIPAPYREALGFAGLTRFDTVLMGRATYDAGLRDGTTSPYPHLRQYWSSRCSRSSPAADSRCSTGSSRRPGSR